MNGYDRIGHFRDVVREYLPHADVVFDKFHIIANYNTTIAAVRRKAWHDAEKQDKFFIKGQRYNNFARKGTLKSKQQVDLDPLLAAHAPLSEVYVLGDQLRTIWQQPTVNQPRSPSTIGSHSLPRARCSPSKLSPHHYDVAPPRSLPTPSPASPRERWRSSTTSSHDSSTASMASDQSLTCSGEPGQRSSHGPVKLSADLHESLFFHVGYGQTDVRRTLGCLYCRTIISAQRWFAAHRQLPCFGFSLEQGDFFPHQRRTDWTAHRYA